MYPRTRPTPERIGPRPRVAAALAGLAVALVATTGVARASSQVAISFDLNEVAPVVYREVGETHATVPEIGLSFDGYEFKGWNTLPDGSGPMIEPGTTVSSSTTLYAQWERNSSLDDVIAESADDASDEAAPSVEDEAGDEEAPSESQMGPADGETSPREDSGALASSTNSAEVAGGDDGIAVMAVSDDATSDSPRDDRSVEERDTDAETKTGLGGIVSTFAGEDAASEADGGGVDEDVSANDAEDADVDAQTGGNGYVPSGTTEATRAQNMPNTAQPPVAAAAIALGVVACVAAGIYVRRHGASALTALVLAAAIVCSGATAARADDGVVGLRVDGTPISGTVTVGDRTWGWSAGELVRGRVVNIGGELLRFDDDGLLVVEGWHQYGGEDTYFEEGDRVYDEVVELADGSFVYLGTDGDPATGVLRRGDRVYFADEAGRLLDPGWHVLGSEFGFSERQLVHIDATTHAAMVGYSSEGYPHWTRPEGYVVRGKWVDDAGLTHIADGVGRLMPDGWVVTDLFDDQTRRYWVDPETHATPKSGLVVIDGETYVVGEEGYVLTGPTLSGGVLVIADDQGRCVVGTGWTYADDPSGSDDDIGDVSGDLGTGVVSASDGDLEGLLGELELELDGPRPSDGPVYYMTTGLSGEIGARVGLFEVDGREYFADRETGEVVMGAEHWDEDTSTLYTCAEDGEVTYRVEMDEAPEKTE